MRTSGLVMLVLLGAGSSCVTLGEHEAKVKELEGLRAQDASSASAREAAMSKRLDDLEVGRQALEKSLRRTGDERDGLRKSLDDAQALTAELKKRLEKLGQNVDQLSSERGQLASALDESKQRLEELRKQKAAAEALAATFRSLVERLKGMIDAGKLKVVLRDGRMLIALPNDVLFDSGRTTVKPEAQAALTEVAHALATIPDRRFLVAGHTDNLPIHTERFASNWELSSARAGEVVRLLLAQGMKPQTLAAAGYGEFDPVAPNDTPESRALNRRIEIVLQPNLGELPDIEKVLGAR